MHSMDRQPSPRTAFAAGGWPSGGWYMHGQGKQEDGDS